MLYVLHINEFSQFHSAVKLTEFKLEKYVRAFGCHIMSALLIILTATVRRQKLHTAELITLFLKVFLFQHLNST